LEKSGENFFITSTPDVRNPRDGVLAPRAGKAGQGRADFVLINFVLKAKKVSTYLQHIFQTVFVVVDREKEMSWKLTITPAYVHGLVIQKKLFEAIIICICSRALINLVLEQ
jgi:hypothetical protein